jgi:hypothetical protein
MALALGLHRCFGTNILRLFGRPLSASIASLRAPENTGLVVSFRSFVSFVPFVP